MQQRRVPSQAAPPSPDAAQPTHSSHSGKIHSLMSATYRSTVWSIFVSCDSHIMMYTEFTATLVKASGYEQLD